MNKNLELLSAAAVGAGLMYFLDPDRGKRRRTLVRDKVTHCVKATNELAEKTGRDVRNHLVGEISRLKSSFQTRDLTDDVLKARVRSKLGRLVSHPREIRVDATNGVVSLTGPIPASEEHSLLDAVTRIRGVKNIENLLELN